MVILVHTTGIGFGRFGVQLFFVISGYLLGLYYETQTNAQFLVHRAFRLFPLAIFFIVVFYLDQIGSFKTILLNLSLTQNLWWNWGSFPGGWSISSEWIYSIILILIVRFKFRYLIALLGIICLLQFTSGLYVYLIGGVSGIDSSVDYMFKTWVNTTNPYINLGFFVAGMILRRASSQILELNRMILFLIVFSMILVDFTLGHLMVGWQFAIPALFILCLRITNMRGVVVRVCNFIGKRTYGIFFVHFLIWNNLSVFFSEAFFAYLTIDPIGKLFQFLFVYLISIIGGALTYKFIERPFLKLSYKIVNKL
jgi:peptidoglycan/LPS O-acetylase OafA/YrhL